MYVESRNVRVTIKAPFLFISFNLMLCAALLFVRRCVVPIQHTLYSKRFTLDALSVRYALSPCGGEKKIKKNVRWENFFLGGRKKHSLKKIACAVVLCVF